MGKELHLAQPVTQDLGVDDLLAIVREVTPTDDNGAGWVELATDKYLRGDISGETYHEALASFHDTYKTYNADIGSNSGLDVATKRRIRKIMLFMNEAAGVGLSDEWSEWMTSRINQVD